MATTKDVCRTNLEQRIKSMEKMIKAAKERLREDDFLQCAVRLEKAADEARFDNMLILIFGSLSRAGEEKDGN